MSSLFKTFQAKQSNKFTELALKTLPVISRDSAKYIFKSIKNGTNVSWNTFESAMSALERKSNLNVQIASYKKVITDKQTNTLREVQFAKQQLMNLTTSPQSTQLIHEIERGFNLEKGSLSPRDINTHLNPSRSANKSLQQIENHRHVHSAPNVNEGKMDEAKEGQDDHKQSYVPQKSSKSAMALNKVKKREIAKPKELTVPSMNTKEYLQFLLERAVTNKVWNDNDADRLCQCAISMKCDWITVNSMWVQQCHQLLKKYALKQYKANLKLHKKSKRRGSKISFKMKKLRNEKKLKSNTKICVTVGYPLGQTSTVSKVAETTQSVHDGAQRIRLMVSAGKVIMADWDYIINEVKCVVAAANGADVRIVFPDTSQITEEIKHTFNQQIMQGMAQKAPAETNPHEIEGAKSKQRRLSKLPLPGPDALTDEETSDDDDEYEANQPGSIGLQKADTLSEKKVNLESETSEDESSHSSLSNSFEDKQHKLRGKRRSLAQKDEKISKHLTAFLGAKRNNNRRASTMTSLKNSKRRKAHKKMRISAKNNEENMSDNSSVSTVSPKNRKIGLIGQSVTATTDIDYDTEPGAESCKKKRRLKKKRKRRRHSKNVAKFDGDGKPKRNKKKDKKKRKKKKDVKGAKKKCKKIKKSEKNQKKSLTKNEKKQEMRRAKSVGVIK